MLAILMAWVVITTSTVDASIFSIRSSHGDLQITVKDESGNTIPFAPTKRSQDSKDDDGLNVYEAISVQPTQTAIGNDSFDIKTASFKNRLFSMLANKNGKKNNDTRNQQNVAIYNGIKRQQIGGRRNRRQLISDCGKIRIKQTIDINGCSKDINVDVCTGSCPNGGSVYFVCRATLTREEPISFQCPGFSTTLRMSMARHCSCIKKADS